MFSACVLFGIILTYLGLLFLIAYYAEIKKGIAANPYIYSLSLAVYCTSWTFYGSVGKAAKEGLIFLTIFIGPTIVIPLWLIIMRKIIYISKKYGITNIADFISFRYGKSLALSALVTLVTVIGITPYIGLQLKAIMSTFALLTDKPQGSHFAGWSIALVLGAFAIIFGARRDIVSERHEGLVFAIAFESVIKLLSFLAVGIFVTFGIFNGFKDIIHQISISGMEYLFKIENSSSVTYIEWTALIILSMMAFMFLPRQFHVAVVENSSEKHLKKAIWFFPLYLFLINLFVLPIAFSGIFLYNTTVGADYFVLTIPLKEGYPGLSVFAFIGGFSAATAMVIVESVAISSMVMNSIVLPFLLRIKHKKGFHLLILNIRRIVIIGGVALGYIFAIYIGEFYSLVDIGLKSFEAVTIFAPTVLFGLYWKRANKKGAIAGIIAGFIVWLYTLLMPALIKAEILPKEGVILSLLKSKIFNPNALFGLEVLDKWSHSLFWELFFNLLFFITLSIFTSESEEETHQAFICVDSYSADTSPLSYFSASASLKEIRTLLSHYIGPTEAEEVIKKFLSKNCKESKSLSEQDLQKLRAYSERVLSGVIGPSLSNLIMKDKTVLTSRERLKISEALREMSRSLKLSREELAEANQKLIELKEFSENILESLPLGIATLDHTRKVTYWNKSMERITGVKKKDAIGTDIQILLTCIMEPDIFNSGIKEGDFICKNVGNTIILQGHLSSLKGLHKGYVLVFEDITEKKRIEEELFRTTKHASIGRLAAGVAHEIGNPLASISSLVQELLSEEQQTPFIKESLKTINHHVERIARIVKNLGDFARLYPRQKVPTNLKEILINTINLVRYDKNFKKIKILTNIDEIPPLKLDPDQIQQVVLNLMLNARDAMPQGGELLIKVKKIDNYVKLIFKDTGEGISDEIKDKIFDPFFTTRAPSKGTGLGLSICYSIIKDHGGTIEIDSKKGKGSAFIISLPL